MIELYDTQGKDRNSTYGNHKHNAEDRLLPKYRLTRL